jgi:hypothetical protein
MTQTLYAHMNKIKIKKSSFLDTLVPFLKITTLRVIFRFGVPVLVPNFVFSSRSGDCTGFLLSGLFCLETCAGMG